MSKNLRRAREYVLDCGGKRSATPLFDSIAGTLPHVLPKRCRRCALPPQSKTWRTFGWFVESFDLQQWMRIGAIYRGTYPGSAGVPPASSGFRLPTGRRDAGAPRRFMESEGLTELAPPKQGQGFVQ